MNFNEFCDTVRAEFPGVHFLLDESRTGPFVASCRHISVKYYRRAKTWEIENRCRLIATGRTLSEPAKVLRLWVAGTVGDARSMGILPPFSALALDALDAAVKEDLAAMSPEALAAAHDRVRAEIRRRLAALKETQ